MYKLGYVKFKDALKVNNVLYIGSLSRKIKIALSFLNYKEQKVV